MMITINNSDEPNKLYDPREKFVNEIGEQLMRYPETTLHLLCSVATVVSLADLREIQKTYKLSLAAGIVKPPKNILN